MIVRCDQRRRRYTSGSIPYVDTLTNKEKSSLC